MKIVGVFDEKVLLSKFNGNIQHYNHLGSNILLGYTLEEDTEISLDDIDNQNYVIIKKLAFSLNYRDRELISVFYYYCQNNPEITHLGIGSDFVGEVISHGALVTHLSIGDRVIPNAAYAKKENGNFILGGIPSNFASEEFSIFHQSQLIRIPGSIPLSIAAGFTVGAQTAYSIVRKLDITSGTNILIISGRSNTSLFTIQAIRARGILCDIHVLTSMPAAENDFFHSIGVNKVINIPKNIKANSFNKLLSGLSKFQYVFDPFFDNNLESILPFIDYYGKYITCGALGNLGTKGAISNRSFVEVINKNISIIGNCLGETADLHQALFDCENGKFNVLVDSLFSYKELASFLDRTYLEKGKKGKVICSLVE